MTLTATAEIDPTFPDVISVDCSFHVKDLVKAVPGARWNLAGRSVWTVPKSWSSCLALRTEFGSGLIIGDHLREWASENGARVKKLVALRSSLEPSDDFAATQDEPGWDELYSYQRAGANLIQLAHGRYLILDETGCGKTRTALAGLASLDRPFPALIVAPKSMLLTWAKEVDDFFGAGTLDVRVVQGTPKKRADLLAPGGDVYIISYGSVRNHSRLLHFGKAKLSDAQREPKELNAIDFRTVLADEIHRAKAPSAAQTRALWGAAGDAPYRIGMTGTPIQENAEDLWAIWRFIAPDIFSSKTAFVERYLQVDWNRWGGREITGINARTEHEFFTILDSMSRRMTKEAALPFLPPKQYEIRWIELPSKMRKAYDEMRKNLRAELEASTVEAGSVLERATRLLQLANASGEVDADGRYHMALPSPKIETFLDDYTGGDWGDESVVVFSESRQLVDLLSVELTRLKIDHGLITGSATTEERQAAIEEFQAKRTKLILITRAGGTGITLTAASVMVRLVRSWSYIEHLQAEDRVHRIGSDVHDSVTYVDYLVSDTVEEAQLIRLNSKEAAAQSVLRDADLLAMLA